MGFDNVADALSVSSVLLERYLEAADIALDAALPSGPRPVEQHWDVPYGIDINPKDYRSRTGVRALEDGTFISFNSGDTPVICEHFKAPVEGDYRFRVRAYAYHSDGKPLVMSIMAGSFDQRNPNRRTVGYYDLPPETVEPRAIEFTEHLPAKGSIKILSFHLGRRNLDTPELVESYEGPGVAIASVEVAGPLTEQWPPQTYRTLLGGVDPQSATVADAGAFCNRSRGGRFAGRSVRTIWLAMSA